mmetsp:Transcript_743/g.1517  ORF Transcript_743/g.1517 Transcript_743/m.1517 type:complete len:118 (-) Transcript_743:1351-1704(-)
MYDDCGGHLHTNRIETKTSTLHGLLPAGYYIIAKPKYWFTTLQPSTIPSSSLSTTPAYPFPAPTHSSPSDPFVLSLPPAKKLEHVFPERGVVSHPSPSSPSTGSHKHAPTLQCPYCP